MTGSRAKELIGRSLGPWQIHGVLGEGGMGVVLLCRRGPIHRAIKLPLVRDEEFLLRFEREAQVLATLGDVPGVVRVHEVLRTEHGPAMVMELIEGESLAQRLKVKGALAEDEAFELVERLAETAAALHERGIWHRDLKPANVLLDRETGAPTLVDFGVAHVSDESLTMTGQALGTLAWMAPEQVAPGRVKPGPACDVWALGVILHECLTGLQPFVGSTSTELVGKIVGGRAELSPELSPVSRETIRGCLSVDPEARPSARELAEGLGSAAAGFDARRLSRLLAGAIVLLMLSVLGVGAVIELRRRGRAVKLARLEQSLADQLAVEERELDTRLVGHIRWRLLGRRGSMVVSLRELERRIKRIRAASEPLRVAAESGGSAVRLLRRFDQLAATVSAMAATESGEASGEVSGEASGQAAPSTSPVEGAPAWRILRALDDGDLAGARAKLAALPRSSRRPSALLELALRLIVARHGGDDDGVEAARFRADAEERTSRDRRLLLRDLSEIHSYDRLEERLRAWRPEERSRAVAHAELARSVADVFAQDIEPVDPVRVAARRRMRRLFTEPRDPSAALSRAWAYLKLRAVGAPRLPEVTELSPTLISALVALPSIRPSGGGDPEVAPIHVIAATIEAYRRGLNEPDDRSFARLEEWLSEHVWLVHMQTWLGGRSRAAETSNRLRLLEAFGKAGVWIFIDDNYLSGLRQQIRGGLPKSLGLRLAVAGGLIEHLADVPCRAESDGPDAETRQVYGERLARLGILVEDRTLPETARLELAAIRPLIEFYAGTRGRRSAADALEAGAGREAHPRRHELLWQASRLLRWIEPDRAERLMERSQAARAKQAAMSLKARSEGRNPLQPLLRVPTRLDKRRRIAEARERSRFELARLQKLASGPTAATRERWEALLSGLQRQLTQRIVDLESTEVPDRHAALRETLALLSCVALAVERREVAEAAFRTARKAMGVTRVELVERGPSVEDECERYLRNVRSRPPH